MSKTTKLETLILEKRGEAATDLEGAANLITGCVAVLLGIAKGVRNLPGDGSAAEWLEMVCKHLDAADDTVREHDARERQMRLAVRPHQGSA